MQREDWLLSMACKIGNIEAIELLVEKYNVRINEIIMLEMFDAKLNPKDNTQKGVEQMKYLL